MGSKRVITSFICISLMLLCICLGGIYFASAIFMLTYAAAKEMVKMFALKDIKPSFAVILLTNLAFLCSAVLGKTSYLGFIVSFGTIAAFLVVLLRKKDGSILDVAFTIIAFLYTGLLPVHIILLRDFDCNILSQDLPFYLQSGLYYIFMAFVTIWGCDIGAYTCGKRYGKTKLAPVVSPNKTIEGAIGGSFVGIAISIFIGLIFGVDLIHGFMLGVLIVIVAQLGDLSESLIKRYIGIKDSGSSLPGHGGVLDRSDSYVFSAFIAYYYVLFFMVPEGYKFL